VAPSSDARGDQWPPSGSLAGLSKSYVSLHIPSSVDRVGLFKWDMRCVAIAAVKRYRHSVVSSTCLPRRALYDRGLSSNDNCRQHGASTSHVQTTQDRGACIYSRSVRQSNDKRSVCFVPVNCAVVVDNRRENHNKHIAVSSATRIARETYTITTRWLIGIGKRAVLNILCLQFCSRCQCASA